MKPLSISVGGKKSPDCVPRAGFNGCLLEEAGENDRLEAVDGDVRDIRLALATITGPAGSLKVHRDCYGHPRTETGQKPLLKYY